MEDPTAERKKELRKRLRPLIAALLPPPIPSPSEASIRATLAEAYPYDDRHGLEATVWSSEVERVVRLAKAARSPIKHRKVKLEDGTEVRVVDDPRQARLL